MNKFARVIATKKAAVGGSLLALGAAAHAEVPAAVATAIGDMKTDGVSMATLVLVAVIAVGAVLFLKKAMGR